MRSEIRRQLHLKAHELIGNVRTFLATFIATNGKIRVQSRRRRKSVGLAEGNFVAAEQILLIVKFLVLADYYPAILFLLTPGAPGSHPDPQHDFSV